MGEKTSFSSFTLTFTKQTKNHYCVLSFILFSTKHSFVIQIEFKLYTHLFGLMWPNFKL